MLLYGRLTNSFLVTSVFQVFPSLVFRASVEKVGIDHGVDLGMYCMGAVSSSDEQPEPCLSIALQES